MGVPDLRLASSVRTPIITCERVSHIYRSLRGDTPALSNVSLNIEKGEFVCLLGPSGCGKTTLLNMLAGFVSPHAGSVCFDGQPIVGPNPKLGIVFQEYSLFPWLTVASNVEFGLRMMGMPASERQTKARGLLQLVGLLDAARKYPFELSGGMKQRVAIARALAPEPEVLLMDEPFAALDAMTRHSLQQQIRQIHRDREQTVIFVTHNIAEAIVLGTRIVVLSALDGVVEDLHVDLPQPVKRTSLGFNRLYEHLERCIGLEGSD